MGRTYGTSRKIPIPDPGMNPWATTWGRAHGTWSKEGGARFRSHGA
jgi:hypothetical protein